MQIDYEGTLTMSKRCTTLLLVIMVIACTDNHGEKSAAEASAAAAPVRSGTPIEASPERLLAEPPSGWLQSFRTESPGIRMVEFVPAQTNADEWTEKVSFESFSDPPLPDPIELLKSIADDQRKACKKFSDHDTFSGVENDYPTSVRLFVCRLNPLNNQGQLTLVKTIRGDTHFYVITRAKRVPPIESDSDMPIPPETMAEWSVYLRAITVCNDTDARHPCPAAPVESNTAAPVASE
jgi:hypothetical protein